MNFKKYILESPITPNLEWKLEVHPENIDIEEIKNHITNIASVLGINGVIYLHICKKLFTEGNGAYWYKIGCVSLNYPFENLKHTLAHEFFHHFQYSKGILKLLNINKNLYLYEGKELKYNSNSSNKKLYFQNPIEIDANEFADWFCKNY